MIKIQRNVLFVPCFWYIAFNRQQYDRGCNLNEPLYYSQSSESLPGIRDLKSEQNTQNLSKMLRQQFRSYECPRVKRDPDPECGSRSKNLITSSLCHTEVLTLFYPNHPNRVDGGHHNNLSPVNLVNCELFHQVFPFEHFTTFFFLNVRPASITNWTYNFQKSN